MDRRQRLAGGHFSCGSPVQALAGSVDRLSGSPKGIYLSIHDPGVGFDAAARRGLGIASMKERIHQVQGEFSIHSEAGQGTEVRVFVPLSKEAA